MRPATASACLVAVAMTACAGGGYAPSSGQQILDDLDAAGLIECVDTRTPFPDIITCVSEEDDADGDGDNDDDITVALADDGAAQMQTVAGDGPHLAGDTWVVLTFDGDEARIEQFQEVLGGGTIYVRNDEGDLVPR